MPNTARFDYLEAPACERCGARTRLSRRQPHPSFGPQFELVTYECGQCGNAQMRSVGPEQDIGR
jgi:hypothetical protein